MRFTASTEWRVGFESRPDGPAGPLDGANPRFLGVRRVRDPICPFRSTNEDEIRVISFRKATPNEAAIFLENIAATTLNFVCGGARFAERLRGLVFFSSLSHVPSAHLNRTQSRTTAAIAIGALTRTASVAAIGQFRASRSFSAEGSASRLVISATAHLGGFDGVSVRRIRPRLRKTARGHLQAKFGGCLWRRRGEWLVGVPSRHSADADAALGSLGSVAKHRSFRAQARRSPL
jgi:hypothetical protein